MDLFAKDLIDAISKIGGLVTVIVAVVLAYHQLGKSRDQKERELEKRDREIKTQRARFWLELRKMFAEHDEVHRLLRDGDWPGTVDPDLNSESSSSDDSSSDETSSDVSSSGESSSGDSSTADQDSSKTGRKPSRGQWASLEAYMGLFEHCNAMLDDDMIDLPTFRSISGIYAFLAGLPMPFMSRGDYYRNRTYLAISITPSLCFSVPMFFASGLIGRWLKVMISGQWCVLDPHGAGKN